MERFTISLNDELAVEFNHWIQSRGYSNRSEAVRDLLRNKIESMRLAENQAVYSVATLSFVFNHHERRLAQRLANLQHEIYDLVVSSMHVHLDHDDCIETLFLRGLTERIRSFADKLSAETGVRHSVINLVPLTLAAQQHADPNHVHFSTLS